MRFGNIFFGMLEFKKKIFMINCKIYQIDQLLIDPHPSFQISI
jgi:hypothetical protein